MWEGLGVKLKPISETHAKPRSASSGGDTPLPPSDGAGMGSNAYIGSLGFQRFPLDGAFEGLVKRGSGLLILLLRNSALLVFDFELK